MSSKKPNNNVEPNGTGELSYTVRTQSEVGTFFGVGQRAVAGWIAQGCPGKVNGTYNLRAIRRWREDTQRRSASSADMSDRAKAMTAESQARAEWHRLKVEKARRELIPLQQAQAAVNEFIAAAQTHLRQLPDRVCAKLAPPPRLRARIHAAVAQGVVEVGEAVAAMMGAIDALGDE